MSGSQPGAGRVQKSTSGGHSIARFRKCKHVHLSGRRCSQKMLKPRLIDASAGVFDWYCMEHGSAKCRECDAMLKAFPIRKTVVPSDLI